MVRAMMTGKHEFLFHHNHHTFHLTAAQLAFVSPPYTRPCNETVQLRTQHPRAVSVSPQLHYGARGRPASESYA